MFTNATQTNEDEIVEIADPRAALEQYWKTQEAVEAEEKQREEDAESQRLEESVKAFLAAYPSLPSLAEAEDFAAVLCAFLSRVGNSVSREWTASRWGETQAWLVAANPLYWIESTNSMPEILLEALEQVRRWKNWKKLGRK